MKIRLVLALVATLILALAGTPAQAVPQPVRAMTYNACGNVCRLGEIELTTSNIAYQIRKNNVTVALLQELCFTQFLRLRSRLVAYGYSAVFGSVATGGRCDDDAAGHGRGFGVAILARGSLRDQVVYRLPSPYGKEAEGRVVLGVTARIAGRTVFVVNTHTTPRGPNLTAQIEALSRWLTPAATTRPVLFGGDLNTLPHAPTLDGFYRAFREANDDRVNPLPTFVQAPRKIDYLFGSRFHLRPRGVVTGCNGYSDHCMLHGVFG